jgi:hypothetical protein
MSFARLKRRGVQAVGLYQAFPVERVSCWRSVCAGKRGGSVMLGLALALFLNQPDHCGRIRVHLSARLIEICSFGWRARSV